MKIKMTPFEKGVESYRFVASIIDHPNILVNYFKSSNLFLSERQIFSDKENRWKRSSIHWFIPQIIAIY